MQGFTKLIIITRLLVQDPVEIKRIQTDLENSLEYKNIEQEASNPKFSVFHVARRTNERVQYEEFNCKQNVQGISDYCSVRFMGQDGL